MTTKRLVLIALGLIVVAGAGYYLFAPKGAAADYRFGTVDRGDIVTSVSATGTLGAVVTVQVGSQLSGQVMELFADFNSIVEANQPIAQLDPASFEARVIEAEALLAIAEANVLAQEAAIERARADLDNTGAALAEARRDRDRKRELRASGNVAQSVLDTAEAAYQQASARHRSNEASLKSAEAQLATARAQVQQRQAQLNNARVDLDRTTIRSPVDGVVISRNVDVGQTVAASFQAPVLFEIAQDLSQMQLEVTVDEADIGRISEGQAVTFSVDAFPQRRFQGTVEQVRLAPRVIQNVVTYTVIVSARNPRGELLPGMTASVEVVDETRTDVMRVPNAALRFRPEGSSAPSAGPGEGGGRRGPQSPEATAALLDSLNLDDAQRAEAEAIFQRSGERMRSLFQSGGDPQSMREEMRQMREQTMRELGAILTEEQRAALAERQGNRQGGGGARPGRVYVLRGGEPVAVDVRTGLSDGSLTELVEGDLEEGDEVIVGRALTFTAPSAPARPGGGGGPRLGF